MSDSLVGLGSHDKALQTLDIFLKSNKKISEDELVKFNKKLSEIKLSKTENANHYYHLDKSFLHSYPVYYETAVLI